MRFTAFLAAATTALCLCAGAMAAQPAAEFYKGRTIIWMVGAGAKSTYGTYARIMAKALEKYLPGDPRVVVKHEPANGGIKAAAFVSNAAPKDGSVLGMAHQNVPIFFILRAQGVNFDVSKWQWIGTMATFGSVLGVWHKAPSKTLEEMLKGRTIIVGATDKSSDTFMSTRLAQKLLGFRFKVVTGYRGSRLLFKAMEQGEIHAFALSYHAFARSNAAWISEGKVEFPLLTGYGPVKGLPELPVMWKMGKTEKDREAMKLVASAERFGRTLFGPAGVPRDRMAMLRRAFDAAMEDKAVIQSFIKRGLPVSPRNGRQVSDLFDELAKTNSAVIAHAKIALGM
jgi:tripartite-type tricarboxylate transporter receptor subunit TctC